MASKTKKLVAEICLYGTQQAGAGWLAQLPGGKLLGDGTLRQGRSFTAALWLACEAVRESIGHTSGLVRVFAAGGERMADADLSRPGYYGDLKWQPATVYVVGSEQLAAV